MSLLKTQAQIAKLESVILDHAGEISDEESDKLEELYFQIEKDRDNAFRFLQLKRPAQIKDQIKSRIEDLKKEIGKLEKIEGAIEGNLYRFLEGKEFYEIKDENGNIEFYAKPDLSIRRSVDIEKTFPKSYKVTIEIETEKAKIELIQWLEKYGYSIISNDVFPNVTDLPDNHPAIIKRIVPKVKFVKNKPKIK